jgi:hypothetical protein
LNSCGPQKKILSYSGLPEGHRHTPFADGIDKIHHQHHDEHEKGDKQGVLEDNDYFHFIFREFFNRPD